jgi:hypothetical protein
MGKKTKHVDKPKVTMKTYKPLVSVCTPTFNRRPFIPIMFDCFRHQTYPKDRIEWIIVDDGTDRIRDLVEEAKRTDIPQIKYYEVDHKMSLGEKRNYMHKHCKGSIIVYMDDDDYYPPDRIEHAVEKLMENKEALCAGSSEMYVYFKHIHKMYQCGPYGPNHATAGTFAFKSRLLDETEYENSAALAEEKKFLKNYTVPFVQLDPMKTILVFSHNHNTFDKKKLLEISHPDYMKESPKTVDMFIKEPYESNIKKFFMEDIDAKLAVYEPGEPKMKPDVIAQTKKIEEERNRQMKEEMQKQGNMPVLTIQEPGQPPRQMSLNEVVEHLKKLQDERVAMSMKITQMQEENNILNTKLNEYLDKYNGANKKVKELMHQVEELQRDGGRRDGGRDGEQTEGENVSTKKSEHVPINSGMSANVSLGVSAQLKPKSKSDPDVFIHI